MQLRFFFSQGLGRVEMLRGRMRAAARYFQEAVAMIEQAPDLVSWNLGLLALALAFTRRRRGGRVAARRGRGGDRVRHARARPRPGPGRDHARDR